LFHPGFGIFFTGCEFVAEVMPLNKFLHQIKILVLLKVGQQPGNTTDGRTQLVEHFRLPVE
jgi:hypothetical protein